MLDASIPEQHLLWQSLVVPKLLPCGKSPSKFQMQHGLRSPGTPADLSCTNPL